MKLEIEENGDIEKIYSDGKLIKKQLVGSQPKY